MKVTILVVFLILLIPALLWARDLGEIARRERERRQLLASGRRSSTARLYTNEDLEAYGQEPAFETSVATQSRGVKRAPAVRARDLEKERVYWRRETEKHRKELARLDARIRKLEWRLEERRARRKIGRLEHDPMEEALQESIASLRDERRRRVEEFFDRGRRAGALPGWLR